MLREAGSHQAVPHDRVGEPHPGVLERELAGASEPRSLRFLATKGDSPHRVIQHGRRGKAVARNCIISVYRNINIHIHINIHIYYIY